MSIEENKEARHKARQQKVKEQVDAKIAAAQEEKGLLLIITGNGKGKSTSGFGTIARAVGHGLNCAVAQFIKGTWDNGERNLLEKLGVEFQVMATGFTWETQNKILKFGRLLNIALHIMHRDPQSKMQKCRE